jgi:hypothetical protein
MSRAGRRVAPVAAALSIALALTGCDVNAAKSTVFITKDSRIVIQELPAKVGEVIFDIENNDDTKHKLILVRLDEGVKPEALPVGADGMIDVGRPRDLEFDGDGYRVLEKLESMRPFFGGSRRSKTVLHTHLSPGRYVVLCNLPGHYERGELAGLEIGERS